VPVDPERPYCSGSFIAVPLTYPCRGSRVLFLSGWHSKRFRRNAWSRHVHGVKLLGVTGCKFFFLCVRGCYLQRIRSPFTEAVRLEF